VPTFAPGVADSHFVKYAVITRRGWGGLVWRRAVLPWVTLMYQFEEELFRMWKNSAGRMVERVMVTPRTCR